MIINWCRYHQNRHIWKEISPNSQKPSTLYIWMPFFLETKNRDTNSSNWPNNMETKCVGINGHHQELLGIRDTTWAYHQIFAVRGQHFWVFWSSNEKISNLQKIYGLTNEIFSGTFFWNILLKDCLKATNVWFSIWSSGYDAKSLTGCWLMASEGFRLGSPPKNISGHPGSDDQHPG